MKNGSDAPSYDFKSSNDICNHCGEKTEHGNVLCNTCRLKRVLLIVASVPAAILTSFIALVIINLPLIYLFQIKIGWLIETILILAIFGGYKKAVDKYIFKPKKVKCNNKEKTNISDKSNTKTKNRFCKICGNPLDENKKCTSCGKQYFYPKRFINKMVPKYCKVCGGIIDKNTKICTKCNKRYRLSSKIILSILLIIISVAVITLSISLISQKINFTPDVEKTYSNDMVVLKSDYVYPGEKAYVEINGKPNTEYRITVTYGDGYVQQTNVSPKITNTSGNSGWRWYVPLNSCRGDCNVYIESDYEYTTTTITIM